MILVGEGDVGEGAGRGVGVDEDVVVAGHEVDPFEVGGYALGGAQDVGVHVLLAVELAAHECEKLLESALGGLDDVCFELLEIVLHCDDVLAVVVLLDDLFVQAVVDTPTQHVGIMRMLNLVSGRRIERCHLLGQQLDMLLGDTTSLVDGLGTLGGTALHLLSLGLDFLMQTLENGKHGALEVLLGVQVHIHNSLSVGPDVFEQTRDTAGALREMMSLFQGVVDRLSLTSTTVH